MRNVALRLAYDGTSYHGWQAQKDVPTVSQTLQAAISAVTGHDVRLTGCGRTDSGVHAETYVANFYTSSLIPLERLPYAINTRLPRDIAVYSAWEVPDDFHSVLSCVRKEDTYNIYSASIPNPFYSNRALFYPGKLNRDAMAEAASHMVGEHDFASMRSMGSNVKTTKRTVFYYNVEEKDGVIRLRVAASGFLYNMARTMAGTLVYVSEGKISPNQIRDILLSCDRGRAGPTLPACGLYMTGVWYNGN